MLQSDCRRRNTRSEHPDAVSYSVRFSSEESAAVTDNDNYIGCNVDDKTLDTFLALLVWLADGVDISVVGRAAIAIEVLMDWATCSWTCEDMAVLSKVLNVMIETKDGSSKLAKTTLEFMQRDEDELVSDAP